MPLTYMTDCVYAQLDRLYAIGARVFVLMNMAPLDLTPLYALPQNGGSVNAQYWTDKAAYDSNVTRPSEKMRLWSMLYMTIKHHMMLSSQIDIRIAVLLFMMCMPW